MPALPVWAVADALRRLPEEELAEALRTKIIPLVTLPGLQLHAACGPVACHAARQQGKRLVAEASAHTFLNAARKALGSRLLKKATYGLANTFPKRSAVHRLSRGQEVAFLLLTAAAVVAGTLAPAGIFQIVLNGLAGLFFLAVIALRILCLMPFPNGPMRTAVSLPANDLPVYSVLVPLFRETSVLSQLLDGLADLDYPTDKLDIKLILEESDILMQRAVFGLRLPPHYDVIVVPSGAPQTKPRALNYALQFSSGSLLTIFDAEDIPEPSQLRLAAETFAALPYEVACLQAALVFFNPHENWLARQFTIEYASLFGVLQPALAAHGLPFPLGGTSNHFRTAILRKVGAWDPFNVTEDADLGLRLARAGYQTGTIASHTLEEANTRLFNWMHQRARWMKGFLQTWLVHSRSPLDFLHEVGPAAAWVTQTMTIGVFGSALLHPVFLAALIIPLLDWSQARPLGNLDIALAGLNLAVFVSGYAVSMLAGLRGLRHLGIRGWGLTLATMPVYWLLMSAAAWLALWQFIVAPFHWNKTQHGLTRVRRPVGQ